MYDMIRNRTKKNRKRTPRGHEHTHERTHIRSKKRQILVIYTYTVHYALLQNGKQETIEAVQPRMESGLHSRRFKGRKWGASILHDRGTNERQGNKH